MSALWSQAQTAEYLGLAVGSMRAIPADKPARYKIGPRGGSVKYRREDIEAYIEASREKVPGKFIRRMVGRPASRRGTSDRPVSISSRVRPRPPAIWEKFIQ